MPQQGLIFRVLVASPSDCVHERRLIPEVIAGWNSIHSLSSAAIIEPILWESHARPDLGKRPQELINTQLVDRCDLVIGSFWTRLGTPTGDSVSGTAEEIEHFRSSGKPVLLYFSSAPVVPESLDPLQYQALIEYKSQLGQHGLYFKYESLSELRDLLQRHLASHMIELLAKTGNATKSEPTLDEPDLQADAIKRFLSEYRSFLRRTNAEWTAERDSDPYKTDDGKYIANRIADELLHFKSRIENDSLGISEKLAECLRRLKTLQRHQVYMDGGQSFQSFWKEGDDILSELGKVADLLATANPEKSGDRES